MSLSKLAYGTLTERRTAQPATQSADDPFELVEVPLGLVEVPFGIDWLDRTRYVAVARGAVIIAEALFGWIR